MIKRYKSAFTPLNSRRKLWALGSRNHKEKKKEQKKPREHLRAQAKMWQRFLIVLAGM